MKLLWFCGSSVAAAAAPCAEGPCRGEITQVWAKSATYPLPLSSEVEEGGYYVTLKETELSEHLQEAPAAL